MINYTVVFRYLTSPVKVQTTLTDLDIAHPYLVIKNILSTLDDTQLSNLSTLEIYSGVSSRNPNGYFLSLDLKNKSINI